MADKNNGLKLGRFSSKLKFYFSLLFISNNDFDILKKHLGKDIDINLLDEKLDELQEQLEIVKWNYNTISLEDNVISRLFLEDELIEYQKKYIINNPNFDLDNPYDIENFLCFCMLSKVKEKKKLDKATVYDLFDPIKKESVKKAIYNLNGYDHEEFTMYYGINYDKKTDINTSDKVRNDLLIKLYTYILKNVEDTDIAVLLKMVSKELIKDYDLYEYIRKLTGDKNLTNEQIGKIVSKLDYNDKLTLKLNYGKDYTEKKKAPEKDEKFKSVIQKVVKEVKKEKKKQKSTSKKETPKKEEPKKEKKEEPKKEEPKKDINQKKKTVNKKEEKKTKKEPKKEKLKKEAPKKEEPKKEIKKENKKERLDKFLSEYNLEKNEFLLAFGMLDLVSRTVIELYFGLKKDKDPIDMDEISRKIDRSLDACWDIFDIATKKIVDLVKSGAIYKPKKEEKKVIKAAKVVVLDEKLRSYVNENNISNDKVIKASKDLSDLSKTVVGLYLGFTTSQKSITEISKKLDISEKSIKSIIDDSTNKIIAELKKEPEEKKEKKEEPKVKEEPKKEEKKEEPKKEKDKETLESFLKANGLTKEEFNYGYKKLQAYEKKIISLYFSAYTVEEIAKKYNMTKDAVNKFITNSKRSIINFANDLKKQESNMTLKKFLNDNNISLQDFNKYYKTLAPVKQNILSLYLGLNGRALSLSEISRRTYRSEDAIKGIIESCVSEIKDAISKNNVKNNRLSEFLKNNNVSRKQLDDSLKKLTEIELIVITMYLGLNGKERPISDIAKTVGLNKVDVINIISDSKKKMFSIEKVNKNQLNQADNLITRARNAFMKVSTNNELLTMLAMVNPINLQILSSLTRGNITMQELSKTFNMTDDKLRTTLNALIDTCDSYTKDTKSISSFSDGLDNEKNKSK